MTKSEQVQHLVDVASQKTKYQFLAYDPVRSFSSESNSTFVGPGDFPGPEDDADSEALFLIGREAWKLMGGASSSEEFYKLVATYREGIGGFRSGFEALKKDGRLVLVTALGQHVVDIELKGADDHVVLQIAWGLHGAGAFDELPPSATAEGEAVSRSELVEHLVWSFAIHALLEIDNALLARLYGDGAIAASLAAAESVANATALAHGDAKLAEARRELSMRAVTAKLDKDPKQQAKRDVQSWWHRWQKDASLYPTKAAFARAMLDKHDGVLVSQKKIEDWCRAWEKEFGTLPVA